MKKILLINLLMSIVSIHGESQILIIESDCQKFNLL